MDDLSVDVDPVSGRAVFEARNMPMPDYHNFVNAVTGGPSIPGIVSFRVEWEVSRDRHRYHYDPNRWEGTFVHNSATCTWTSRTAEARFSTDTNDPTIFAEVGYERNGVFFA